jgi:Na+-translocating ferredoxin:NAD+ oxidoreductase RnfG subunit
MEVGTANERAPTPEDVSLIVIYHRSRPASSIGLIVVAAAAIAALVLCDRASAQEGTFLSEAEAPAAVFPDADSFVREVVNVTPELREKMRAVLGATQLSVWEDQYVTFRALHGGVLIGYAIIVEEIGKHRPITFVVGVQPDDKVNDVAVLAYREAYGGEVRNKRFLTQYHGKSSGDALQPYADIKNIAGATLSVEAAGRAVKKAMALVRVAFGARGGG